MTKATKGNPLDLRVWLDKVRDLGELTEVNGADWNLELGAISELNVKKAVPPALLFDEITGHPKGFRMVTCSTSSPARLSTILRLETERSQLKLVQALRGKPMQWQAGAPAYDPVFTDTGPVFENTLSGDAVDAYKFPSPLWHEKDGGRYIGTGCMVVTRDFDSDWINVGCYRNMNHDRNHVGLNMGPNKHGAIQFNKYMKAGKPFPVAIVLGCDPLGYWISGLEIPFGICEYNYIGSIMKEPVSLVRGPLTGLPFPSASEIVLEGWAHPGDERIEGPFGEFHGYYSSLAEVTPVTTIERIYYRNDPIALGSPPAKPPHDFSYAKAVVRSAMLTDALQAGGVPDVVAAWAHEIGGARMFNVVSIKQRYSGHARQAGHVLSQCGVGAHLSRYAIVVDDDIDPSNLHEVMWAVATRTDPDLDIDIIKRGIGTKADPMSVAYQHKGFCSKAVIDACRPYDFINEFPPVAEASKELQEKTRAKWHHIL